MLSFVKKVNYQQDLEWNEWNIAAKKRILLDDENNRCRQVYSPTMPVYYVTKKLFPVAEHKLAHLVGAVPPNKLAQPHKRRKNLQILEW